MKHVTPASSILKRIFDVVASGAGLLIASPVILICVYRIKNFDGGPALYLPNRAGVGGHEFRMFKLRSMVVNADKSGVASTANSDSRITPVGKFIRKFKIDEIMQLINVLKGDMSLVGPRPNLKREVDAYTEVEARLVSVRPGITDFSSVVFSDEGAILEGYPDADLAYNQLIRPWKSRLGLFYIDRRTMSIDIQLLLITVMSIVSRARALALTSALLSRLGADPQLVEVAARTTELTPYPPPGASTIVGSLPVKRHKTTGP